MTFEIGLLLAILVIALILFSLEWVSADIVALGVMLALVLTGLLPADQAFAGFGSDTALLILGLLILTSALVRTGVVDLLGRFIMRYSGDTPGRIQAVITVATTTLSSIMSNTAAAAMFIPIAMGLARRAHISPSRVLMPLAFGAILASSVTLIATSTNVVVSGLMVKAGLAPMGMFELTPVGIPIAIVGVLYMLTIGNRIAPERIPPEELTEEFGLTSYLTEALILPDSRLIDKTLDEARLGSDLDLTVLQVMRGEERYPAPMASIALREGDVLLVEGPRDHILKMKDRAGVAIKADITLSDPDLETDNIGLVEVILLLRSPLVGRTLKGVGFRQLYGLQVLAINRHGDMLLNKLSQIPLRMGDVLLLQGPRANLAALEKDSTFRILGRVTEKRMNMTRARLALGFFLGAILLATVEVLSLPVAMLLGSVGAFVTRCITPEEAYRDVDWKLIILIACMLGFGAAMESTGAARYLAGLIVQFAGQSDPIWLLTGFFALTVALTQPMSNQAAAAVVLPVAIQAAVQLGLNPRAFAMMIAVAASTSYITPLEPACLMVYGLGRYKFFDFVRVGSLLTIIIYLIAIFMVPRIWALR
jgi:di/tricarboxylate transporter